jgi:hypothetical protein
VTPLYAHRRGYDVGDELRAQIPDMEREEALQIARATAVAEHPDIAAIDQQRTREMAALEAKFAQLYAQAAATIDPDAEITKKIQARAERVMQAAMVLISATAAVPSDGTRFLVSDSGVDLVSTGAGIARKFGHRRNVNTGTQAITAATSTKINGSELAVPAGFNIQVGSVFQWQIVATKTAAGTALRTFFVRLGTNGTTADTAIASFTSAAGTAVADVAYIEIIAVCVSIAANIATFECSFILSHNLASTGWATTGNQVVSPPTTTATLDISTAGLIMSLSLTTGTAEAPTIRQVFAQAFNV